MSKGLLTVGSVARELGVSRYRVHQFIKQGRLVGAFQVDSGQWLIPGEALKTVRVRKTGRPKAKKKTTKRPS